MLRIALALLATMHGIAHLVGFAVSWRYVQTPELPHTTRVLDDRVDLGQDGIRTYGLFWLLTATAFLLTALGALADAVWWEAAMLAASMISLALSILSFPRSRFGIPVNLVLLLTIIAGLRFGWL